LYKAEIEANLRTPELSGYKIMDLHDFPGQGEALVGMLDAFWDSKGIVTPTEHRQYCNDTVPLLNIQKYVWTNDETLEANIQISHYGKNDLNNADIEWKIFSRDGKAWKSGQFKKTLPTGHLIDVGYIEYGLSDIKVPKQLRMSIVIKNTPFKNEWNLWVLPANPDDTIPADILVTHAFDEQTRTLLSRGKKVLLLPPFQKENELVVRSRFLPVFWSFTWAPGQSGILGIFCNPDHPLFAEFPTEFHSDWQWYDLTESSQAFVLNSTPKSFRPLIQAIDDFHRNDKLGYVFETRVGTGKLLLCGFDLESDLQNRPAAKQFRTSLFRYMSSEKFDPTAELDVAFLQNLVSSD
jgi:hypothetical protein